MLGLLSCKVRHLILVVLLSCVCATSCAPTAPSLVAEGLLTGEPCGPPCWQGLMPGVSTEEELDEFFRTSEYVVPCSAYKDRFWNTWTIWWRPRWQSRLHNNSSLRGGVLEVMRMYVDSEVALDQLLDRYGPPDKIAAGLSRHPEPVFIRVLLFYPDYGMILELHLPEHDPRLSPETELVLVEYFEPAPLDDVLVTLYWGKGNLRTEEQRATLEGWLRGWHDWEGYGSVITEAPMLPPGPPGTP